jgi:hypothetical protein
VGREESTTETFFKKGTAEYNSALADFMSYIKTPADLEANQAEVLRTIGTDGYEYIWDKVKPAETKTEKLDLESLEDETVEYLENPQTCGGYVEGRLKAMGQSDSFIQSYLLVQYGIQKDETGKYIVVDAKTWGS